MLNSIRTKKERTKMTLKEITNLTEKSHENFTRRFKETVQSIFQLFLNEEFEYTMNKLKESGVQVYRNGTKSRRLKTNAGEIELQVPQFRHQPFQPSIYEPYSRVEKTLGATIQEMFLQGVSTRKTRKILKQMGMEDFDKSSVSRLTKKLDEELQPWLQRDLSNKDYPFLMIDARYEKIREHGQVVSNAVYVIVGIDKDGYRDILGVYVEESETLLGWKNTFKDLTSRGLTGVQYIVSDQHKGLVKAIGEEFTGVLWQRCSVHFQRNFLSKLPKQYQYRYTKKLGLIWNFSTKAQARNYITMLISELREDKLHRAADFLEEEIEETLSVYDLNEYLRKKMKSTNMLERFNQELKRRSKVVRIFPSKSSCLRLMGMLCKQQSEEWISGNKYIPIENNQEGIVATLQPPLEKLKHVD